MVWLIMWRTKVRSSSVIVVVDLACRSLEGLKGEGEGRYFVEKDGAVDYKEVVAGWHVAESLGIDEVVEGGEQGLGGVYGFVDEACIGSCGVDQWHWAVRVVLAVFLEGYCSGDGCLIGEGVNVETEVIVGEKQTCF